MNRQSAVTHQASRSRLRRSAVLLSIAIPLAACGSETSATTRPAVDADAAGQRATPTVLPPAALAAWETYAREQCRAAGERFATVRFAPLSGQGEAIDQVERQFATSRGGFVAAEFNGDGRPDFIVVTPNQGCVSEGQPYGQSGPPNTFIVSTTAGYQASEGFMGWVGAAMVTRRGDRDVLDYSGGFNGQCGPITNVVWGWEGTRMGALERRNERGDLVDQEGCAQAAPARTTTAAAGQVAFPPIPKGYYAYGMTCARAIAGGGADSPPDNLVYFTETGLSYSDGGPEIQGFESLGNDRYRIRARQYGNGDDPTGEQADLVIRVTGPASFQTENPMIGYTHCPSNQVPRAIRENWFEPQD